MAYSASLRSYTTSSVPGVGGTGSAGPIATPGSIVKHSSTTDSSSTAITAGERICEPQLDYHAVVGFDASAKAAPPIERAATAVKVSIPGAGNCDHSLLVPHRQHIGRIPTSLI
jgi:hypothetical protein